MQRGISAAETSVELGISAYGGEEITWGGAAGTFGKNFAINSLTGGIGNKLKWGGKASAYLLRQGIEISGDTSYDVLVRGQDFGSSLLVNAAGSIGGEALFRGVAYAARAGGPHVGRALVNTGVVSPTGIQAGYFRVQWGLGVVGHSRGNGLARRPGGYRTGDTDAHLLLSPGANRATGATNTRTDGFVQSHHGIQRQWAKRNVDGYDEFAAPAVLLKSLSGEPHALISAAQRARRRARGGWETDIRTEFNLSYGEMLDSGISRRDAKRVISQNYKYFDSIGAFD